MRQRTCAALAALTLVLFAGCTKPTQTAGGFDWPQWRGPDGNGQSRETEWDAASIANPKILWNVNVGSGYSTVVVQAGRLYTMGMREGKLLVFCPDAVTGRRIWQRDLVTHSPPQSTPAVDGEWLIVLTTDGYLYGIDSRNGRLRWKKDLVADYGAVKPYYSFSGSPVIDGETIILTANSAGMAIKIDTGELSWTSEKPPKSFRSIMGSFGTTGTAFATPVIYSWRGSRNALLAGWNGLSSVDAATGKLAWRFDWEITPDLIPDPVIANNMICVAQAYDSSGGQSGFLLQQHEDGPVVLWRTQELFSFGTPPVIVDDCIFTGYIGPTGETMSTYTSLRCFDLKTGNLMWEEKFGPSRMDKAFSLTVANGTLILLDDRGTLYTATASPEGFKEIARCDVLQGASKPRLFWTPPVLCNAKIYCRNFGGDLVCIDVSR